MREKFKKAFGTNENEIKYSVMHFLENWCHQPSRYLTQDEKDFKEEVQTIIDSWGGENA